MEPTDTPVVPKHGRAPDRPTRRQPNVKVRLLITIPTIVVLFTLSAGLLGMNLTKIALLSPVGGALWKTSVKAILPVEVWIVLFGLIAGGAGLLLAYGITRPLKKIYSETETLLKKDPSLSPFSVTAANEVVAASAFLEHTFNVLNRIVQDHYILDALPEGILSLDAEGKILSLNKVATETLGVQSSEYVGKSYQELFPPAADNETLFFLIRRLLQEKREATLALVFCTTISNKRGVFWLKLSRPHDQLDGGGIITIKDLEEVEQIREQIRRVEQLISLGSLSAELAHELRNPLAAIQGHAQLLMQGIRLEDKQRSYVEMILSEVERLSGLSQDLLTFASSNQTKPQLCAVGSLIQEALTTAPTPFEQKRITVTIQEPPIGEDKILADREKMVQALVNVITNAFHSTPEGGEIHISTQKREGKIAIRIANTGSFIPPERRQKVFVPFYTTRAGGTGLGLAIVQRIVMAHNGMIELESDEQKGTAFIFELPLYGPAT